jgi:O-antigen/teichoic acid export membrane protein
MSQPKHIILKRFGYLLSGHWVREVMQTAFLLILARHATETYGQFMLAINIGQLLLFATEFGLNQHLTTMLARKENFPTRILGQITLIKSLFLLLGWLAMLGFIFWQDYSGQLRLIILIIATAIAIEGLGNSFYVACRVLGRQDVEGKTRALGALLGYGYGIIALLAGIPSIFVGLYKGMETLTNLSVVFRAFFSRIRHQILLKDFRELWRVWREGLVFTAMAVCAIFYNKINLFFLQNNAGAEGVAQYSATWQIVDGISIMVSSMLLGKVLFPLFAKYWTSNRDEFTRLARQSAAWLVAVALPVIYVLFVESDRIITLVYGHNYGPAITAQKLLVGCILFAFIHNLASYLMVSMAKQRLLLVMYVTGLVFNLGACIWPTRYTPLANASLAILLTKGVMALMTVSFCQFTLKLFTPMNVLKQGIAVAAAAAIHLTLSPILLREAVELLTLLPLLFHAYRLYLRQKRAVAPQQTS